MDPLNLSWYDDDVESQNWSRPFNGSEAKADRPHYNYYAMLLTLLIFIIVFGNVLVCMAVSREKALQTTTNYLIVSLAVADLLVATLVMPWVVYLEVGPGPCLAPALCQSLGGKGSLVIRKYETFAQEGGTSGVSMLWRVGTLGLARLRPLLLPMLPPCRYTAVAMPMLYNTRYSSKRRVTVMIAIVWVLSFTISCPLLFGLNNTDQNECIIANPAFVVYSSIVSFYVPFIVTLLVYIKIYIVLRKRRKRVNTKRSSRAFRANLKAPLKGNYTHSEDMQLCTVIMKSNGSFPVNRRRVEAARRAQAQELEMEMLSSTSPPERTRYSPIPPSHHQLTLPDSSHHGLHTTPDSPAKPEKNGHAKDHPKIAKIFEIQSMPNGKTRTSLKTMSRRKLSQQKEKKATQMLAIVLGVFIICWLPFFITHILNIHCDCNIPPVLYSAFTWLGYVNSAVNPIIYTTFNIEFRKAFMKILHC
nr:D(2) dopamine receptor [Loxodonta africana]